MTARDLWIVHPPHQYQTVEDLPGWANKCGACSQTLADGDHDPDGGILHTRRIDPLNFEEHPWHLMSVLTGVSDLRALTLETVGGETVRYEWRISDE